MRSLAASPEEGEAEVRRQRSILAEDRWLSSLAGKSDMVYVRHYKGGLLVGRLRQTRGGGGGVEEGDDDDDDDDDDCAIYFSRCDFIITAAKAGDEKRGVAVKLHYDHNARQSDQPTLELGKWTGAQLKTYYGPRQRR